jgi:membrane-bound lytic murein transglycosylase D
LYTNKTSYNDTTKSDKTIPANFTREYEPPASNVSFIKYPANLQDNMEQSLDYIKKYSSKRRHDLIKTYKKGKKYFPQITEVLKRYKLPQELKVLIALESGFNANAVSKQGAVGYWQITDKVAKQYGLQIVRAKDPAAIRLNRKDDRKNLSKSTVCAAKYLRDRRSNFNNDLLLMVASYNAGIGTVWNAMKKYGKPDADFWDIKKYLPAETRNFVMNFITLNVIFENYENFAKNQLVFAPELVNNQPAYTTPNIF